MSRTRIDLVTRAEILEAQAELLSREGPLPDGHDRMALNVIADLAKLVRDLVVETQHKSVAPKDDAG